MNYFLQEEPNKLVVQEALETMVMSDVYLSRLTPQTKLVFRCPLQERK